MYSEAHVLCVTFCPSTYSHTRSIPNKMSTVESLKPRERKIDAIKVLIFPVLFTVHNSVMFYNTCHNSIYSVSTVYFVSDHNFVYF